MKNFTTATSAHNTRHVITYIKDVRCSLNTRSSLLLLKFNRIEDHLVSSWCTTRGKNKRTKIAWSQILKNQREFNIYQKRTSQSERAWKFIRILVKHFSASEILQQHTNMNIRLSYHRNSCTINQTHNKKTPSTIAAQLAVIFFYSDFTFFGRNIKEENTGLCSV